MKTTRTALAAFLTAPAWFAAPAWAQLAAPVPAPSAPPAPAAPGPVPQATLGDALTQGKPVLELRARYEAVDDSVNRDADALTLRTVLGYQTGTYQGFGAYLEFENVSAVGDDDDYNSGTTGEGNRNTAYALIPDPELTQVNQAYLSAYGLKAGRQRIVYDNARFIGDVAWRQNDQTYTGVSFSNATWLPGLAVNLAYIHEVHNIFGVTRDVSDPWVNLKYSGFQGHNLTGFYYGLEEDEAPAASLQHLGARADGKFGPLLYDLSYARQDDYQDSVSKDADYYDLQLGYAYAGWTLKLQHEVLEPNFNTPLATLHTFNGWVDKFLVTPADGLRDTNLKLLGTLAKVGLVVAYHDFRADRGGQDYGRELDASALYKFTDRLIGLVKYGDYDAEPTAPGPLGRDTRKFWLMVTYKF